MKRILTLTALLLTCTAAAVAQPQAPGSAAGTVVADPAPGVSVTGTATERNGDYLAVDFTLRLSDLRVESGRALLLTPWLEQEGHSLELPSVGIYGRDRYYHYVRQGESMLTGAEETSLRASRMPDTLAYHRLVPYEEWMNGAQLVLRRTDYGCCSTVLAEHATPLARHTEAPAYFPQAVYAQPAAAAVKTRSLEGSAYIDFPVNKTDIRPTYRRNADELARIRATIDSVRLDSDVSITSVSLRGYASPESPYSHNAMLAKGRTESLKAYILKLYRFDEELISTSHEPEDWAGLRRYVERSELPHRAELLALIDGPLQPDAKEARIRRAYPAEYRHLLQECYPALRHTDYRIAYTVRSYTDVDEIKTVMKSRPQKLDLNEFYLAAASLEPGTDEYAEVFETAVRMYPDAPAANLNAAHAAMRRGELDAAARYLTKAGDTPEAAYARAALAYLQGDYAAALPLARRAQESGVEEAAVLAAEAEKQLKKTESGKVKMEN